MKFKKTKIRVSTVITLVIVMIGIVCLANGGETNKSIMTNNIEKKEQIDSVIEKNIIAWAEAFCNREIRTITKMASKECIEGIAKADKTTLHYQDNKIVGIGWSSPWPWKLVDGGKNTPESRYRIIKADNYSAEILYYALVSDPHIFVWHETINFDYSNNNFVVTSEEIDFFDSISSNADFFKAYPDGIIAGTTMDYITNNMGENLRNSANNSPQYYSELSDPEKAALYILNIVDDAVETKYYTENNQHYVEVNFKNDNTSIKILMVQIYDKIWVPEGVL